MNCPKELKYTSEHEWIRLVGNIATVGITDYAQDQLGDIVFVELPESGETLKTGASFGVVESTKSVSDLYAPLSGKIIATNDPLLDTPELINDDPYGEGWMIQLEIADPSQLEKLLDVASYQKQIQEEA